MTLVYSGQTVPTWRGAPWQFHIRECGGGGDCLFHSLAAGFRLSHPKLSSQLDPRKMLARSLREDNFRLYFSETRAELPPVTLSAAQSIVSTPGWRHQGTDVTLRYLAEFDAFCRSARYGFIVLSSYGPAYTQIIGPRESTLFLTLFHDARSQHWQLAYLDGLPFLSRHSWMVRYKQLKQMKF